MNRIITIGREFGSGGRELGRRLSEELECAYYDSEILSEIAKRTELSEKYVVSIVEQRPIISFPIHIGRTFEAITPMTVVAPDQSVYAAQCAIVREMAQKSDCVIVGRCADYILKEYKPFRIFVYADMPGKMARCREKVPEQKNMTDRELKKYIAEIDKNRRAYYEFYTNRKWGDRNNYDLCINTTDKSIKEIAPHIAKLLK